MDETKNVIFKVQIDIALEVWFSIAVIFSENMHSFMGRIYVILYFYRRPTYEPEVRIGGNGEIKLSTTEGTC